MKQIQRCHDVCGCGGEDLLNCAEFCHSDHMTETDRMLLCDDPAQLKLQMFSYKDYKRTLRAEG